MQAKLAFDEGELGRRDQPPMRDPDTIERAVEIGGPEVQKIRKLGKARREIVILPDIALEEARMVRDAIEDLGRGEGEALDLALEGMVGHGGPACFCRPDSQFLT